MQVKPLKEGEKAVFRLLNAHVKEKGRDEPTCPENVWLSDKEFIYDPYAQKSVLIGNVTGLRAVRESGGNIKISESGAPMMIPDTSKPQFVRGYCILSAEQTSTFAFLMRSKKCKDNPWKPRGVKATFELVTESKEKNEALQKIDLQFDAQKLVREKEWSDLKAIKAKLKQSPDAALHVSADDNDFKGLKLELIRISQSHPKQLIMASEDIPSKVKVLIMESKMFGILTITDGAWSLMSKDGKWTKICQTEPHKDEVQTLIDHFLSKDGHTDYISTTKELEYILKAKK